jgi:GNAT superfamily N-acetyltransferase
VDASVDGYEIVAYSDHYRQDVLRFRSGFRAIADVWNAEHFRWQQEENPWFDGHQIGLALHRGEVVGMRVFQAAEWEAGVPAVRFRAPCYSGTVIEDGHRSRGLMTRLSRALEDAALRGGARFALNLNAGPVTHLGALAEGWRALGAFGAVVRPQANSGFRPVERAVRVLRRALASLRPAPGTGVKLSRRTRPDEMAELAARRTDRGGIRHVKDARWFRWRYRDPSSRYRFVYFERDSRLVGYLALHRDAPPLPSGPLDVVDWEKGDRLEWSEMLAVALRVADRLVLPLTTWSAAWPPEVRTRLSELGFEPRPLWGALANRRPTFLVGRLDRGRVGAEAGDGSDSDAAWSVGGLRIDDVGSWDLRPIFADCF